MPRFDGYVDAIRCRVIDGWAADIHAPESPVSVELRCDDVVVAQAIANRYRADLQAAGLGRGRLGFALAVPDACHDGNLHRLSVRIVGAEQPLAGLPNDGCFENATAPSFVGEVLALTGSELRGFVYLEQEPGNPVRVDLVADGEVIDSRIASSWNQEDTPERVPLNCSFRFDLPEVWTPQLLTARISVVVAGTTVELVNPFARPAIDLIQLSGVELHNEQLSGSVFVPAFIPDRLEFSVQINGRMIDEPDWRHEEVTTDGVKRLFVVQLDEAEIHGQVDVRVSLRQTNQLVGNGHRKLWAQSRENVVANPFFDRWQGGALSAWQPFADRVERLTPEFCRLDEKLGEGRNFSRYALRCDLRPVDGSRRAVVGMAPILMQQLDIDALPPGSTFELRLVSHADVASQLVAELLVETEECGEVLISMPLRVRQRWSAVSETIALPESCSRFRAATLRLVAAPDLSRLRIAVLGLGVKGFSLSPDSAESGGELPAEIAEGPAVARNAVINGGFELWQHGLKFQGGGKRFEAADHWTVYVKKASPQVTASIACVRTRDPSLAFEGEERFGLSFVGSDEGLSRLEAELDPFSLERNVPTCLRFFARRNVRSGQQNVPGAALADCFIHRVVLLRRTMDLAAADPASTARDEMIAVIGRRLPLSLTGRYHDLPFQRTEVQWREDLEAGHGLPNLQVQFVLGFEFADEVAVTLADVYFGPPAREAESASAGEISTYVSLEDPSILGQIGLIKGIETWAAEKPRSVMRPQATEAERVGGRVMTDSEAVARWKIPYARFPLVDIVIPIFNAPDEVMQCLASIERCTRVPHLLTLVDDASDEATARQLRHFADRRPWVRLLRNEVNLGYTRSANLGMAQSASDWVLLLNSDTVVTPGWLEGMLECAASDPAIRFVGALSNAASWQSVPEIKDRSGRWKVNSVPEGLSVEDIARLIADVSPRDFPDVPLLNGFCTLMDRAVLDEIGFLDEQAFPVGYGEENDLCIRVAKAGYRLALADHVYVYHHKSASFGTERRAGLAKQGMARLLAKHPGTDIGRLQEQLAAVPSLLTIRNALGARLGLEPSILHVAA